jgi:signal transduction histidine kinase
MALFTPEAIAQPITNLHQLTQALSSSPQACHDVDLTVTVCASSRPRVGVLIVQDGTGCELLEMGDFGRDIPPGEHLRIRQDSCFMRKREMGIELSTPPVVNNDGVHRRTCASGQSTLPRGKIPLRLEWFNYRSSYDLEVSWAPFNSTIRPVESSNLWHTAGNEAGAIRYLPGLRAECHEGIWESIPDFNLLQPVKTGVVTNLGVGLGLAIRSREEWTGIRFTGFLEVPEAGPYRFEICSDDGALLFLGDPVVPVDCLGRTNVPAAKPAPSLHGFADPAERCWTVAEGHVSFVSRSGEGLRFDLETDGHLIAVRLADATGLDLAALMNARVRVTGIGRGIMTANLVPMLGKLFLADARDLVLLEMPAPRDSPALPITSVARVQNLPIERARQSLPVRIRGTVTETARTSQGRWMSFQDDTRGIFVKLPGITNTTPASGELWEVEGRSDAGDFAPVIVAERITRLGEGMLPAPVRPTWTELLNGSRDVQWAELNGLVTDVHSNTLSLHLPEGRLEVELEGSSESDLLPHLKSVVRIRGVLYAVWDTGTREVRVGRVMMRGATLSVEIPAPGDPFDAVSRTPRDLLLFDAQASAFRPVKVSGQIVHADPTQLFLQADGDGIRLLPMHPANLRPGDLVDAVGYPNIGKSELLLRDALLRKTGEAPLPPPKDLDDPGLSRKNLNFSRVRVTGKLLGWHGGERSPVLEMQSGSRLFLARIAPGVATFPSLRPGSRLSLVGVHVGGVAGQESNAGSESFEMLLNSPAAITVLSQPSWWTLPRLLTLVGILVVVMVFTIIWNTQLRHLVEQRTSQLRQEIRERERLEHQHALDTERSRIARDLHDDLGSSLTEISVLASTGQMPQAGDSGQHGLFQAIGDRARGLISALDAIVWAVDPEDNSLQSLADYLTGYADDFFSHTHIACRFKVPVSCPAFTLEGRVRHELLLATKEAFNNIARHAGATEVEFRLGVGDHGLEIDITDNGKGIPDATTGGGHGLKNLAARLQQLGGRCQVESRPGGGTIIKIRLPLPPVKG